MEELVDALQREAKACEIYRALEIPKSTYYYRLSQRRRESKVKRQAQQAKVRQIHERVDGCYGSRRMSVELRAQGIDAGRYKARSLMKEAEVVAQMPKPPAKPKVGGKSDHVAPHHLNRQFEVSAPNRVFAGDITYIYTAMGWLYLAVVIDLFSRKVVGWAFSQRPDSQLTCRALRLALQARKPPRGLMFHSDQGCQYSAKDFRQLLSEEGIVQSMSRRGNCWDNSVVERFFRSLRTEKIRRRIYPSLNAAQSEISEYMVGFYNLTRRHSTLGYLSPVDYEKQQSVVVKKAA